LSPDASSDEPGSDRLTAGQVNAAHLRAAPVIVLAACRAADVTPYLQARWSLPDAFLHAGARAVIAADVELPDRESNQFFAELRRRLAAGESPSAAVAAVRRDPTWSTWSAHVMVFDAGAP
jgi:cellulose synthase operon protein C